MSIIHEAIVAELPYLRSEAEGQMTLTFAAYSPGAPTTGADGMESPTWVAESTTIGKIRGNSLIAHDTSSRTVIVGLVARPIIEGVLHIPIAAQLPETGWEYVCTAAPANTDPALVGTRWHVVNVPIETTATARRLEVVRL